MYGPCRTVTEAYACGGDLEGLPCVASVLQHATRLVTLSSSQLVVHGCSQFEFFAEDEELTIVPYFSLETDNSTLNCIAVSTGPQYCHPMCAPWLSLSEGFICRAIMGHFNQTFQSMFHSGWLSCCTSGRNAAYTRRTGCNQVTFKVSCRTRMWQETRHAGASTCSAPCIAGGRCP